MVAANENAIREVVREVLTQLGRNGAAPEPRHNGHTASGDWGVFETVDQAAAAAQDGFRQLCDVGLEERRQIVQIVKNICVGQAEELGRLEYEETKIGRLDHKIEKLKIIARVPGVESLRTEAVSGDHGLTIEEHAPFGVIGAITPVTHSLPTLAGNVVNMLAAGNTVVFNAHPGGKQIAIEGAQRFNRAIHKALGLTNLITIIRNPTIDSAEQIFNHRGIRLLVVTGGPAVARAALASRKRAIVAGPGNPPVLVDETADLDNAARCIVTGGAFDNNLLCIGEKEVFAVDSIFNSLMDRMDRHGGYRLSAAQIDGLARAAFTPPKEPGGHWVLNRDLVGKDPQVLADTIGLKLPGGVQLLYGETDTKNPFVFEEQMMPFVPFVRCRDADEGIRLCVEFEHGFGHTAIIHSRNVRTMTTMARAMDTTLFIKNGPTPAGLGLGGEGFLSYSIATPTGEGVTSPMTFTRQRRCAMVDDLRIF